MRIKQKWYNIKNSIWFLPSVMALIAVMAAWGFIELDSVITYDDLPFNWFVYGGQRDGARSVLSTIAASMVTISGVTFSITLVALTMASAQFGPRLLRNFIADRGNQFVIGTLISTFIYSLIILLAIRSSDDSEFIPKISVIFAFVLAIFSLGVLIYFIHNVTTSIQADYVIKASFNEFKNVANATLTENSDVSYPSYDSVLQSLRNQYEYATELHFDESGYIQSVDYDSSCKWAQKNNYAIEWVVYTGLFATIHTPFAVLHHNVPLDKKVKNQLLNSIVVAYQRTPNQDLLFSLKQIVEVGVRALSPGINDPHTAITCAHWLGAALTELGTKKMDTPVLTDINGEVRVLRRQISYQMVVDTCFDHLRLYAKSNMYVGVELLSAIEKPLYRTDISEFRSILFSKAEAIYNDSKPSADDQMLPALELKFKNIRQELGQINVMS